MTPEEKDILTKNIKIELLNLETNISRLQKECEPITPQCALGDLARFELMNDQEVFKKSLQQALIRKKKLINALSKINNKNFGLCVECDEPISFDRLLLLPESTHCMECLKH